MLYRRVVHGSILCDPIQPNPTQLMGHGSTQPMDNSGTKRRRGAATASVCRRPRRQGRAGGRAAVSRSRRSQCGDGGGGAVGRPTTTVAGRRPLIDRTNVADLLLTRPTHHHRPTDLCQCTGHSPPPTLLSPTRKSPSETSGVAFTRHRSVFLSC